MPLPTKRNNMTDEEEIAAAPAEEEVVEEEVEMSVLDALKEVSNQR